MRTSRRVSVIIPNYNYEKYLAQAVTSVLKQKEVDVELIVVDDGSTDSSLKILESFGDTIKLISTINNGSIIARNIGLQNATGEFICYLDSDDYFLDNRLIDHIAFMEMNNLDFSFCRLAEASSQDGNTDLPQYLTKRDFFFNPAVSIVIPSSVIMTKYLANRVGHWDTALASPAEDFDYFRRCTNFSDLVLYNKQLVVRRLHSQSLSKSIPLERYYSDNCKATIKMYVDWSQHFNTLERRVSWFRLQLMFCKSALKHRNMALFFLALRKMLSPILL